MIILFVKTDIDAKIKYYKTGINEKCASSVFFSSHTKCKTKKLKSKTSKICFSFLVLKTGK